MITPVAAITLEYRGPLRTIACVVSLLAEGVSRVMIFDNSDDDGASAGTLRTAFDGDARVRIVGGNRNLGFAAGVNEAIALLRDEGWKGRVLLVNNDAVVEAGALGALGRALDNHPDVAMVYPRIFQGGKFQSLVRYHPATGRLSQGSLQGGMPYASGCCLLLAVAEVKADLFDETFFMYGEDVELSARLRREGRRVMQVLDAVVVHEGSGGSGFNTLFYETHTVAAHVILAWRLAETPARLVLHVSGRLVFLPLRAMLRAMRYRSWIPLRGLVDGVRIGRAALRARAKTPADHAPR
ncbi:glycosyltransferase family 2 protein [Luteibacter aegosomatis]|uniref:glycosyltransferase n=1 Tax=Luteibacter aegosomatis TaxID=2911537 RepID=UPI001FF95E70|nr:glycosyltransferase family 2 protein [Luteibacter aegosomatis]UPG84811.1 glycosyltransferase family 2 protein [Luteibacter aegosomatis]